MLEVWQNGKRVTAGLLPWDKYVEAVRAQKPKKRTGNPNGGPNKRNVACLQNIPAARRCEFVHSRGPKAGSRCGSWAMRGAQRCNKHGGIRQNPHHPAARAALGIIEQRDANTNARRQAHKDFSTETIHTVIQALSPKGGAWDWHAILAACHAITQDDGGKAWRRYLQNRTEPAKEQRNRKKRT